jgi:hypothetical protein
MLWHARRASGRPVDPQGADGRQLVSAPALGYPASAAEKAMAERHQGGFWTTIPGVLTGLAALITSVTGAAIFLNGTAKSPDPVPAPQPAPSPGPGSEAGSNPPAEDGTSQPPAPVPTPASAAADPVAEQVKATAAVLNALMPQQVDAITTRTGVTADGRILTMHHRVTQRTGSDDAVRAYVRAFACSDSDIREDLDNLGVTYRLSYSFPDSKVPLDVDVTSATCAGF